MRTWCVPGKRYEVGVSREDRTKKVKQERDFRSKTGRTWLLTGCGIWEKVGCLVTKVLGEVRLQLLPRVRA